MVIDNHNKSVVDRPEPVKKPRKGPSAPASGAPPADAPAAPKSAPAMSADRAARLAALFSGGAAAGGKKKKFSMA